MSINQLPPSDSQENEADKLKSVDRVILTLQKANNILRVINASLSTNDLYQNFALELAKIISYERLVFITLSTQNGVTHAKAEFDTAKPADDSKRKTLVKNFLKHILENETGFISYEVKDLEQESELTEFISAETALLVLLPLRTEETILGGLLITSTSANVLSETNLTLLEILRVQFANIWRSAKIFDRMNRSRLQWQTTLDAMPDMMILLDVTENQILQINTAAAGLIGRTPKELVNKNFQEVFGAVDPPLAGIPLAKITPDALSYSEESVSLISGLVYQRSFYPIFDSSDELSELVIHIKDITETKFMQERLTQAARLKALGEMASGVAHDLNNTLATILGNVELLLLEVDDHNQRNQLMQLKQATLDSSVTVKRIQAFGLREQTRNHYQPVSLTQVASEVIELTRPRWQNQLQRRRIPVNVSKKLSGNLFVMGSSAELKEVITNLVFNALDAMPKGGTLSLSSYIEHNESSIRTGNFAVLEVHDSGIGIPPEIAPNIFEPFFTTKGQSGTGLGLSMARQIINEHQGEITFKSESGFGTTFLIKLPLLKLEEHQSKPLSEPVVISRAKKARSSKKCKILVIDDDESLANILLRILVRQGHEVKLASNGILGLELFKHNNFDIVLTDLNMPEMSGFEVVRSIREFNSKIVVAFITGWGNELSQEVITAAGIDLVIAKPYRIEEVNILLEKAIALIGR
jgi:signal transduction histidine kinase